MSRVIVMALIVCVLETTGVAGQSEVRLRVVQEPSGRPLASAFVYAGGQGGPATRSHTDDEGRFTIAGNLGAELLVQVQCPVERALFGRLLEPVRIVRGSDTLPWVRIPDDACREPPEEERVVELEGVLKLGVEPSSFSPCGGFPEVEHTAYGFDNVSAWVEFRDSPPRLPEALVREGYNGYSEAVWFVRVRGTLLGPGGYGHLSGSVYQLTVDSIIEASAGSPEDCR